MLSQIAKHVQSAREFCTQPAFTVLVVAVSFFTDMLSYGIIVPIMPSALVDRAHVPAEDQQFWTSTLLILESCAALLVNPLAGYWTDLSTRRQIPFLSGLALLAVSLACIALATSLNALIVGRCLQGAATGVLFVAGVALVLDCISPDAVAVTLGWLSAANTAGFTVGPAVGGVLYQFGGWWAVFGPMFGVLLVDLVLRLMVVEKRAVTLQGVSGREEGSLSGATTAHAAAAAVATDGKRKSSIIPLLRQPRMLLLLWGVTASGAIVSCFDVTLPIFVHGHFGWNALGQGLIFLPTALPSVLDPLYGHCVDRFGVRAVACSSFLALAPVLAALTLVSEDNLTNKVLLVILLVIIGIFIDIADIALMVETDNVVRDVSIEQPNAFSENGAVAQAFSLQAMAYHVGILLGPSLSVLTEAHGGWSAMVGTLGLLSAVSAVAMLRVGRSSRKGGSKHGTDEADILLSESTTRSEEAD